MITLEDIVRISWILARDMNRHNDKIVRSGNGILLRGMRIVPDSRVAIAAACLRTDLCLCGCNQ